MNRFFQKSCHAAVPLILYSLICGYGLLLPSTTASENSVAEEVISLDVKNRPLGDVLEDISAETGYEFSIDESWANFPVSASIRNEPLHIGLKRILRNFNSAVIYGSDRVIKIKIYDREKSSRHPAGQSAVNRSYQETVRQPVGSANPRTLPPGLQLRDRKTLPQTDEHTDEESSESESEPAEAEDSKEEEEHQQSGAAADAEAEEEPADSGSKSAEDGSGEDSTETVETDTASETSSDTGAAVNE
jgi:hypothetical protein